MDDLAKFLQFIFGDQSGIIYLPTKDPKTSEWVQHFFDWPQEQPTIIESAKKYNKEGLDVYYSPCLFLQRSAKKTSFKGTNVSWAEFDLGIPQNLDGVPIPSATIVSSTDSHQHWYWRFQEFQTEPKLIEAISHKITYSLGADKSGWDVNQVLRLPTLKHIRKNLTTRLLTLQDGLTYEISDFAGINDPRRPESTSISVDKLPRLSSTVARYAWSDDNFDFFESDTIPVGSRSSALTKIGFICTEMGMSIEETLTVLLNADDRWGKFKGRPDRLTRLLGIVNHCRTTKREKEEFQEILGLQTLLRSESKVEWLIPDILYRKAIAVLCGPPGVGKSLLSMQLGINSGLGGRFLDRQLIKPCRTVFISMEMGKEECQSSLSMMSRELGPVDLDNLEDNFLIFPIGEHIPLHLPAGREAIVRILDKYNPDGVMFDSLGAAVENVNDDVQVKKMYDFINTEIRNRHNAFTWFIHHPRKWEQGRSRKSEPTIDDVFGSRYITALASIVMNLKPLGNDKMKLDFLKVRMAPVPESIILSRNPDDLLTNVIARGNIRTTDKPDKQRGILDI